MHAVSSEFLFVEKAFKTLDPNKQNYPPLYICVLHDII